MQNPLNFIAVEGPIGAGKTTLVKMLSEDFKGQAIYEPLEKNPFLTEFYKNRDKNAFKTQIFFLLNRYQQQLELKQTNLFKLPVVCDYTFVKDAIFAKINLSEEEQKLYKTIFDLLKGKLPKPDLVIYLRADAEILLQRVKKRGIDYERSISKDYLESLTQAYDSLFLSYNETPLLVVDTTRTNYPGNRQDYENLKREILNHKGGTTHLIARP